jgi:hypothetical protein
LIAAAPKSSYFALRATGALDAVILVLKHRLLDLVIQIKDVVIIVDLLHTRSRPGRASFNGSSGFGL